MPKKYDKQTIKSRACVYLTETRSNISQAINYIVRVNQNHEYVHECEAISNGYTKNRKYRNLIGLKRIFQRG